MKSSLLSLPSTEKSMLRPELPPKETALMRALVGSEGSTGAVNGAIKEMLAKLRAESGISARSADVTTVCTVAEDLSSGWVAREGPRSATSMDWRSDSGTRMIRREDCEPRATTIDLFCEAKPEAETESWYIDGLREMNRASPLKFVVRLSCAFDFGSERETFADGMEAPEESVTATASEARSS